MLPPPSHGNPPPAPSSERKRPPPHPRRRNRPGSKRPRTVFHLDDVTVVAPPEVIGDSPKTTVAAPKPSPTDAQAPESKATTATARGNGSSGNASNNHASNNHASSDVFPAKKPPPPSTTQRLPQDAQQKPSPSEKVVVPHQALPAPEPVVDAATAAAAARGNSSNSSSENVSNKPSSSFPARQPPLSTPPPQEANQNKAPASSANANIQNTPSSISNTVAREISSSSHSKEPNGDILPTEAKEQEHPPNSDSKDDNHHQFSDAVEDNDTSMEDVHPETNVPPWALRADQHVLEDWIMNRLNEKIRVAERKEEDLVMNYYDEEILMQQLYVQAYPTPHGVTDDDDEHETETETEIDESPASSSPKAVDQETTSSTVRRVNTNEGGEHQKAPPPTVIPSSPPEPPSVARQTIPPQLDDPPNTTVFRRVIPKWIPSASSSSSAPRKRLFTVQDFEACVFRPMANKIAGEAAPQSMKLLEEAPGDPHSYLLEVRFRNNNNPKNQNKNRLDHTWVQVAATAEAYVRSKISGVNLGRLLADPSSLEVSLSLSLNQPLGVSFSKFTLVQGGHTVGGDHGDGKGSSSSGGLWIKRVLPGGLARALRGQPFARGCALLSANGTSINDPLQLQELLVQAKKRSDPKVSIRLLLSKHSDLTAIPWEELVSDKYKLRRRDGKPIDPSEYPGLKAPVITTTTSSKSSSNKNSTVATKSRAPAAASPSTTMDSPRQSPTDKESKGLGKRTREPSPLSSPETTKKKRVDPKTAVHPAFLDPRKVTAANSSDGSTTKASKATRDTTEDQSSSSPKPIEAAHLSKKAKGNTPRTESPTDNHPPTVSHKHSASSTADKIPNQKTSPSETPTESTKGTETVPPAKNIAERNPHPSDGVSISSEDTTSNSDAPKSASKASTKPVNEISSTSNSNVSASSKTEKAGPPTKPGVQETSAPLNNKYASEKPPSTETKPLTPSSNDRSTPDSDASNNSYPTFDVRDDEGKPPRRTSRWELEINKKRAEDHNSQEKVQSKSAIVVNEKPSGSSQSLPESKMASEKNLPSSSSQDRSTASSGSDKASADEESLPKPANGSRTAHNSRVEAQSTKPAGGSQPFWMKLDNMSKARKESSLEQVSNTRKSDEKEPQKTLDKEVPNTAKPTGSVAKAREESPPEQTRDTTKSEQKEHRIKTSESNSTSHDENSYPKAQDFDSRSQQNINLKRGSWSGQPRRGSSYFPKEWPTDILIERPFEVILDPRYPLGGYFRTERIRNIHAQPKCLLFSICRNGQLANDPRVKIGTQVTATLEGERRYPVSDHQQLVLHYNNAKQKRTKLRLILQNTSSCRIEHSGVSSINWGSSGEWTGYERSGWAGGAQDTKSQDVINASNLRSSFTGSLSNSVGDDEGRWSDKEGYFSGGSRSTSPTIEMEINTRQPTPNYLPGEEAFLDIIRNESCKELISVLESGPDMSISFVRNVLQRQCTYISDELKKMHPGSREAQDLVAKKKVLKVYINSAYLIEKAESLRNWTEVMIEVKFVHLLRLPSANVGGRSRLVNTKVRTKNPDTELGNLPLQSTRYRIDYSQNQFSTHNNYKSSIVRRLILEISEGNPNRDRAKPFQFGEFDFTVNEIEKLCSSDGNWKHIEKRNESIGTIGLCAKRRSAAKDYVAKKRLEILGSLKKQLETVELFNLEYSATKSTKMTANIRGFNGSSLLYAAVEVMADALLIQKILDLGGDPQQAPKSDSQRTPLGLAREQFDRSVAKAKSASDEGKPPSVQQAYAQKSSEAKRLVEMLEASK